VERISTAEAARRLGVSQSAIRGRIAAGQLRAETEVRLQGSRFWVRWDASPATVRDATTTAPDVSMTMRHTAPQTPVTPPKRRS
jgi:hypothetical protein